MRLRSLVSAVLAAMVAGSAAAAALPNYNAIADAPRVELGVARARLEALSQAPSIRVQWDDRFGVPNFVWAGAKRSGTVAAAKVAQSDESSARQFLSEYASLYALDAGDVANAVVSGVHDIGEGAVIIKLKQRIGDVDVFREELNVVMGQDRELIALTGHISAVPRANRVIASAAKANPFLLGPANAIASAFSDATTGEMPVAIESLTFAGQSEGGYQLYAGSGPEPIRVKRVYFHLPDRYEPAYYLEVAVGGDANTTSEMYGYVISAIDGKLLFRNSLIADQAAPAPFSYRVWAGGSDNIPLPGPYGYDGTPNPTASLDGYQPLYATPSLITLAHGSISTRDPWLPASANETNGNNVDAFIDEYEPDGFSAGDFRATTTGLLTFDRVYDVTKSPSSSREQMMAATTQLFYVTNFLHDWFYDAGFNEAAGNAQTNNFGRGGLGNDSMRAEAQDYSGRNNANMATPADGRGPRMQMYVWDNVGNRSLQVTSPTNIAKLYSTGTAVFGQQSFNLSGDVVSTTPADACTAITNNVAGKIVFVDRGGLNNTCTFVLKAQNAMAAGAVGIIVGNVPTSTGPETIVSMGCNATGPCSASEMTLPPILHVVLSTATAFRSALANGGTMRVTMRRDASVDHDGTIDNQIIAHEWMHYMTYRLVANSSGLNSNQSRGMGEGWSDFASLLMSVRPDDTRFASNSTFNGAYGMALYVATGGSNGPEMNNGTYWGIRRVPYSTDMTKNPLTLKHVTASVPIEGATVRYGATGETNSEVHATGEVWATMLWEAYASLLRDTLGNSPRLTFAQAQQRMKEYLVASLKMTPSDPTFLEARDAILAAAFARDIVDYQRFWEAFAKRGAGINAVAPDRFSIFNYTATNDFNAGGALTITSVTFDDNITSCVRNGSLEAGETGAMRIVFKNTGAARMEATTLTVSTTDPALTFPSGSSTAVLASSPGETVTASIIASIAPGVVAVLKPDVTITLNDPRITAPGGLKSLHLARLNAVAEPKTSAADDVENSTSAWTISGSGAAEWRRIEITPRDHRWFAAEPDAQVDTSLVSPPLMVSPHGDFTLTFRHRFAFDHFIDIGVLGFVDGGVIEISTDNGLSWTDIGNRIDPSTLGYGMGSILTKNGSAIEGRRSFQATSPGFTQENPSRAPFSTTKVNLGSDYAGKRVRVRFRSVTAADHSFAPRLGWEIDDIAFTNIDNLPFSPLNGDRGACGVSASATSLSASAFNAEGGVPVTFTATVSGAIAPSGSVDFLDNGAILATALIQNGVARFTSATLPSGTHNIVATFNGSKNFAASTSSQVTVQIGPPGAQRRRTVGH